MSHPYGMMFRISRYLLPVLQLFAMWNAGSVSGQLQHPGRPLTDPGRLKAAEVVYLLPPVDPLKVEAAMAQNRGGGRKSFQFALERPVALNPESHGAWSEQEDFRIWTVHLISPGARSLGLVFQPFRLRSGVNLFVYTPDRAVVRGAFTSGNNKSSGILPVGHLPGEEIVLEMQVPAEYDGYGELQLEMVSHAFLDPGERSDAMDCGPGEFGCSHPCEIDINCREGADWQLEKRSVVRIFTTRQYCTGVLVNNTSYDETPYILTAEHCINRKYYADRSVFLFNYESPGCFGGDGRLDMSVAGCDSIAIGDSLDFSLLRLSVTPPDSFGIYYAGWNRSDFQSSGTATIHHPWGDVKKISFDSEIPSIPARQGDVPYTDLEDYYYFSYWWIREWDTGTTEGGSSGSPLFNDAREVIGVLSGGIARCGDSIGYDEESDRVIFNNVFNYDDYYTRMRYAWDFNGPEGPSLKPWLDPLNTGAISLSGTLPVSARSDRIHPSNLYFRVFPNPVRDRIRLIPGRVLSNSVSWMLSDLSGRIRYAGSVGPGGGELVFPSGLKQGIYMLRLESPGFIEHHKLLVQ